MSDKQAKQKQVKQQEAELARQLLQSDPESPDDSSFHDAEPAEDISDVSDLSDREPAREDQAPASDTAFEKWKAQRVIERKQELASAAADLVPLQLSESIQIWLPVELHGVVDTLWGNQPSTASAFETWSAFLDLVYRSQATSISPASRIYLLALAIEKYELVLQTLGSGNIHAATRNLENQLHLVKLYYHVTEELRHSGWLAPRPDVSDATLPALLSLVEKKSASLLCMFGGQGVEWLPELREIYSTYPMIRPLIGRAAQTLLIQLERGSVLSDAIYSHGFDILSWVRDPESAPPPEYLRSAPISYPAIGLVQLSHYALTLRLWNISPSTFFQFVSGFTGHSQGLLSACAAALSKTESELESNICTTVAIMFWLGHYAQTCTPFPSGVSALRADILRESEQNGDGSPTPMLAIFKLPPPIVQGYVDHVNKQLSETAALHRRLSICLVNGPRAVVVCGHPESLHVLAVTLRTREAPANVPLDQARIPFSKRKRAFVLKYLPISAPFHDSSCLDRVPELVVAECARMGITWNAADLAAPLFSTKDGHNLQQSSSLLTDVIALQTVELLVWPTCMDAALAHSQATHIIDFGPGETAGVGSVCARIYHGAGVQVIMAGSFKSGSNLADKSVLFDRRESAIPFGRNYAKEYAPELVRRRSDDKLVVRTKFSELIGKPPVMVAGMTPCTVNPHLVAAISNSGYHGELAGGGLHNEPIFRTAVNTLLGATENGLGVSLNFLFLNAYLWGYQFPLVSRLRAEGIPIESVTVAAGVPSPDKASEILSALRAAGLNFVAFKPGSIQAILDVVAIARAHPQSNVVLQWTGGRGGGHHSFEDFHEPILETYTRIRECPNLILVAGSGFGDAEGSWPYLSGEWSLRFGHPKMPFDGILVGSRVMVAKEATTANEAKELLVATPGVAKDSEWENSYETQAGGVVTVLSELGEPIHKVATRGVLLWRELDNDIFSLAPDKQASTIAAKKAYIIKRLNADFQKPFFGRKMDGTVVDLPEMTYQEVLIRMLALFYVQSSETKKMFWIDPTFRSRIYMFAQRVEERFSPRNSKPTASQLPAESLLNENPTAFLDQIFEKFPRAVQQLLCSEDVDYFLEVCRIVYFKPVNFVPVVDGDLKFWFKKDSLWYSEALDAVPDRDIQRVAILQGPLAVRFATKANEPVGDILNSIHDGYIAKLLPGHKDKPIPVVEYIGGPALRVVEKAELKGVSIEELSPNATSPSVPISNTGPRVLRSKGRKSFSRSDAHEELNAVLSSSIPAGGRSIVAEIVAGVDGMPDVETWLQWLSGPVQSWWRALLVSPHVVQHKRQVENTVSRLFRPRPGIFVQLVFSTASDDVPSSVLLFEEKPTDSSVAPVVQVTWNSETSLITVVIHHERPASVTTPEALVPLPFYFKYRPEQGFSLIHEEMENRNRRIKEFYAKLWFGDEVARYNDAFEAKALSAEFSSSYSITRDALDRFGRATHHAPTQLPDGRLQGGVSFAIVVAWEPLIKSIFPSEIDGDILALVHLSNSYETLDGCSVRLQEGAQVYTKFSIVEVLNSSSEFNGKRVTVEGTMSYLNDGVKTPFLRLRSQFLFRGVFLDHAKCFRLSRDVRLVHMEKEEDLAILRSKLWLKWGDAQVSVGDTLSFEVESTEIYGSSLDVFASVEVKGTVKHASSNAALVLAHIAYSTTNTKGNVVSSYLTRFGHPAHPAIFFSTGGYHLMSKSDVLAAPAENTDYALASLDLNPIHTNPTFAEQAGLPATITHGMWTSANAFRVLETFAAKNQADRVRKYSAEFVGMVTPGEPLTTRLKHIGMREGRMIVEVKTTNAAGVTVLKGRGEVAMQPTAYVFTGQGSAEVGMGLDLYASSPVAKKIWDAADAYFLNNFGFSILEIVRQNPKSISIYFGGLKGAAIRQQYRSLTQQVLVKENGEFVRQVRPLFPDISVDAISHTFHHPEGLLFATQFTQPALTLVELSAFQDMRSRGIVPDNCAFAGHSLGEYAGLAAVANVLTVEALVGIVFLRGMTMQNAVLRNAEGHSQYAMTAVNPGRVHKKFREPHLQQVVEALGAASRELIQVVNFNVENYQYVVAGERGNLHALGLVLQSLKDNGCDLSALPTLVQSALRDTAQAKADSPSGLIALERSLASIPLPGIDVPFHSRFLEGGVPAFREILQRNMTPTQIDLNTLVGRYVPNLTATPFAATREYAEVTYELTKSPVLQSMLAEWSSNPPDSQKLAYALVVELLAYQFASPVRWIETQQQFFNKMGIERLIEVGPAPTLFTMAKRTLAQGDYSPLVPRELLWYNRDRTAIYFEHTDELEVEASPASRPASTPAPAPTPAPVVRPPAPAHAASGPAAAVADVSLTALDFLQALLAVRLQKSISEIAPSVTLKSVVGGKSALQNELLGDIEKEFGGRVPEGAGEQTLAQLSEQLSPGYKQLGKVSTAMVHKMLSSKLPAGYSLSKVRGYLTTSFGLGDGRSQAVLLQALSSEPKARLGSDADAASWLDAVVSSYGARIGVSLSKGGNTAPAPMASAPVAASAGPAASVPDTPVQPLEFMRMLVATKLKKPLTSVEPSATIKSVVGGKSALQNELVGELAKEFGTEPEGAAEVPLEQAASKFSGNYKKLGPHSSQLVARLFSSKMPAGFTQSAARSYLSSQHGLGEGRTDSVLLYALAAQPESRLPNEEGAKQWLDSVVRTYATDAKISLGAASSSHVAASGGVGGGAVLSASQLQEIQGSQLTFVRKQLAACQDYLDQDPLAAARATEREVELRKAAEASVAQFVAEHGEQYVQGLAPVFDAAKERHFDSFWNWTRQDVLTLYYDKTCGRTPRWGQDIRARVFHIKNRSGSGCW
eukprot:TRINITY_DN910_c0_g1_i1.p1 TRINITY_DN910_c0_g1~~TRINITY_DN910_c0_g1_i1.p1  ORF type:complete len:2842 (-),score=503.53 TRINITY_DN910_c0_g1_i1:4431-12935(-)